MGWVEGPFEAKLVSMLLRAATPDDAGEVANVHVRSWQVGYRGLMPDEYLDALRPEDRAKRYTFGSRDPLQLATIVAVDEGAICGFATTGPAWGTDGHGSGELHGLYVDPPSWGLGVGRALIAAAREHLRSQDFTEACLWVLVGNDRAERFYRADGWVSDGTQRVAAVHGLVVNEVRYDRQLV
jgi:ribosomal protein S18 acetylase RimI-like enzyme